MQCVTPPTPNIPALSRKEPPAHQRFVTNMDIGRAFQNAPPVYRAVYAGALQQIHSALICKMYVEVEIAELQEAGRREREALDLLHTKRAQGQLSDRRWWRRFVVLSRGRFRNRAYRQVLSEVPDTLDAVEQRVWGDIKRGAVLDLSPVDRYVGEVNQRLGRINSCHGRKGGGFVIDLYGHYK